MTSSVLFDHVQQAAAQAGFDLCGIAPASPSPHADFVRQWIAASKHGEMNYLENHLDKRLDVRRMMPGCQAVIVVAKFYAERGDVVHECDSSCRDQPRTTGKVSRYATDFPGPGRDTPADGSLPGKDYHTWMKKRLHGMADALRETFRDEQWRACVDTAPVMEREHAAAAGLGWIGKHTLVIHPKRGSWMMLGCLLTSAKLPTSVSMGYPGGLVNDDDHCGTCTRCIDACPTDAITPYSVDARRCISYLTIEHRDEIEPGLASKMDGWIAGCDVCQEVCPHNRVETKPVDKRTADAAGREYRLPLDEVQQWNAEDRAAALRGHALKRIKLEMWHRNAKIAEHSSQTETDS